MSRSSWKLNYLPKSVNKQLKKKKSLNIWTRAALIPSFLLNRLVKVYNGKVLETDQTRDGEGKNASVRVNLCGHRSIKNTKPYKRNKYISSYITYRNNPTP